MVDILLNVFFGVKMAKGLLTCFFTAYLELHKTISISIIFTQY